MAGGGSEDSSESGIGENAGQSSALLQVPAVVVASPRDSHSSVVGGGGGPQLPKQVSQPELGGESRSVVHQYSSHHPMISRSLGSMGSVTGSEFMSQGNQQQQQQQQQQQHHLQVMQVYVSKQQLQQHQLTRSSSGQLATVSLSGGSSTSSALLSSQGLGNLRPIQPKPTHDEGSQVTMQVQRSIIKEEQALYYHHQQQRKDGGPPLIRLIPSEDVGQSCPPARLPRAVSEEPLASRPTSLTTDLLGQVPAVLTQSVSQDTGLDGGLPRSSSVSQSQSSLNLPSSILSTTSLSSSYSSTLSTLPPASGHRLALRDGPALGCNYCWNSTDDHGRIQRRKTKYHCPECRTNLCIVPCYQKYHKQMERADDTDRQISKILTKTPSL